MYKACLLLLSNLSPKLGFSPRSVADGTATSDLSSSSADWRESAVAGIEILGLDTSASTTLRFSVARDLRGMSKKVDLRLKSSSSIELKIESNGEKIDIGRRGCGAAARRCPPVWLEDVSEVDAVVDPSEALSRSGRGELLIAGSRSSPRR